MVTGANLQATIGDLVPFTCYNVRVRARNGVGQSMPGPPSIDFYTEPEGRCLCKGSESGLCEWRSVPGRLADWLLRDVLLFHE